MNPSQIYVAVAIVALLIITVLLLLTRRTQRSTRLRPLTLLAFGFVLAGLLFDQDRLLSYGLLSMGVLLAVADIILRLRRT